MLFQAFFNFDWIQCMHAPIKQKAINRKVRKTPFLSQEILSRLRLNHFSPCLYMYKMYMPMVHRDSAPIADLGFVDVGALNILPIYKSDEAQDSKIQRFYI